MNVTLLLGVKITHFRSVKLHFDPLILPGSPRASIDKEIAASLLDLSKGTDSQENEADQGAIKSGTGTMN